GVGPDPALHGEGAAEGRRRVHELEQVESRGHAVGRTPERDHHPGPVVRDVGPGQDRAAAEDRGVPGRPRIVGRDPLDGRRSPRGKRRSDRLDRGALRAGSGGQPEREGGDGQVSSSQHVPSFPPAWRSTVRAARARRRDRACTFVRSPPPSSAILPFPGPAMTTSPEARARTAELLDTAAPGDARTLDALVPIVYDELRAIAHRQLAGEREDHTLQTTALAHEAYLRLVDDSRVTRRGRAYFFGAVARAMRQILVDHARKKGAL